MVKSCVYYKTLKSNRIDERFESILSTFPNCTSVNTNRIDSECDLAIIQGWAKKNFNSPHNVLREKVIANQYRKNKHTLTIDGDVFGYIKKNVYFRYSIDGIFANTGYYFDKKIDPNRWASIQQNIGVELKPWRKTGDHILILLQKHSGWSTCGKDVFEWCKETIHHIRKHSDRKIVIRMHPSDVKYLHPTIKTLEANNIKVSSSKHILDDLKNAWCSVSHNSSPGVVSAIEGIPVFLTDTDWKRSHCAGIGNINIENIEAPILKERDRWIQKIAMSHFTIDDIKGGLLWEYVNNFLEDKIK